ncbi:RHS repeat-associated core domain-containing protein [Parvularcula sp. LCG005]|uniref:RHS repeat domain-containing protein n=1 Tax=Parvularcula sp. LCG005 TaxID=3078805 RepID=UPI002943060A|nr:RHS repeat-associated core domain-containing protein [Parvularcula sp. LCG005]WOI53025.1 RHS repeat-associated core domain-containing protein [Parvularcula sp. LCG005]
MLSRILALLFYFAVSISPALAQSDDGVDSGKAQLKKTEEIEEESAALMAPPPGGGGGPGGGGYEVEIDTMPRQRVNDRLSAYDPNLLGDRIDPFTGSLTFQTTDVSIPGNSHLPVSIGRLNEPGLPSRPDMQKLFGDWILDVPFLNLPTPKEDTYGVGGWQDDRCTGSFDPGGISKNGVDWEPYEYFHGVTVNAPGHGSQQLLEATAASHFGGFAAKHTTKQHWRFDCIGDIGGGAGEGFIGYAPNGDKFYFDHLVNFVNNPLTGKGILPMWNTYMFATRVEDVHGNWVEYDWVGHRLNSIRANDGRRIDLTYKSGTDLIETVSANGRTWTYAYVDYSTLATVTRPDGRQWVLDVPSRLGSTSACGLGSAGYSITLTHPDGTSGTFSTTGVRLGRTNVPIVLNYIGSQYQANPPPDGPCGAERGFFIPRHFYSQAVTQKVLTVPGYGTASWQFGYEQDEGNFNNNGQLTGSNWSHLYTALADTRTNWVIDPTGAKTTTQFSRRYDWTEGLPKQIKRYDTNATTLLETETLTYILGHHLGTNNIELSNNQPSNYANYLTQRVIVRNGVTYNTKNTYSINQNSTTFSYGNPTKVEEWSSNSGDTRVTDYTYVHEKDNWNVGLVDTVTRNGKLFDDFEYDGVGRKLTHDQFGVRVATYQYYTSGSAAGLPSIVDDALNRRTSYFDYKRGQPQRIKRPDNVQVYSVIDDNGWMTSVTNARGKTTLYDYNDIGRLTFINPPLGASTSVSYLYGVNSSGVIHQKFHTDNFDETISYDAMMRPTMVKSEALSGPGDTTYSRTTYDGLGRVSFSSLPSFNPNPTIGHVTSYDGLGRVTGVLENASGGGTTSYAYLTGNKVRVTDPVGHQTTTTRKGYASPDDGQPTLIEQPLNTKTAMTYDVYGNLKTARQYGTQNGYTVDYTQSYFYDAKLRLCRHSVPETGDTAYLYDSAGQLTSYAEGQTPGTSCLTTLPGASAVVLGYDAMGRVTDINYPGSTPDIAKTYSNTGYPSSINRGGANWSYIRNTNDQLTRETLTIDGRTYETSYDYNGLKHLKSMTYPTGQVVEFAPDAFGRPTKAQKVASTIYASALTYHPNAAFKTMTMGNGKEVWYQQNGRQLLMQIYYQSAIRMYYYYDANGRVTSIDHDNATDQDRTFTYDGHGRLLTAAGPWGAGGYKYDAVGNLRSKTLGGRVVTANYQSTTNRLSQVQDSAAGSGWRTYGYDNRGNVTNDGNLAFTYDFSNQPVAISGAVSGAYTYDGNLKRVKQIVNGKTIYSVYGESGQLIHRDNITLGEKTDYIHAGGLLVAEVENSTPTYAVLNHLGTPVAHQSASGAVVQAEVQTPFGESYSSTNNSSSDVGFTGHVRDADTGLTYMQARYYDPVIGRFLSNDPVAFTPDKPGHFNRYAYTLNDPVNATDPTGMCIELNCPWGYTTAHMTAQNTYRDIPVKAGTMAIGGTWSRTVTDARGRKSVVQTTLGVAIGSTEGAEELGIAVFSSVEYGIGSEHGFGSFLAAYSGDPANFEGAYSTTGGQGLFGLFGAGYTKADGLEGLQFNVGTPGASSMVGYTKVIGGLGKAFDKPPSQDSDRTRFSLGNKGRTGGCLRSEAQGGCSSDN